jgi:hypothetical protein
MSDDDLAIARIAQNVRANFLGHGVLSDQIKLENTGISTLRLKKI